MPAILRVVPRFWQTEWFRILVGAVALLMLIGAVTWNERRKARRRLERLEARHAVEQVRQRIARDLHDELGSAITEIVQLGGKRVPITTLFADVRGIAAKTAKTAHIGKQYRDRLAAPAQLHVTGLGQYLFNHRWSHVALKQAANMLFLPFFGVLELAH